MRSSAHSGGVHPTLQAIADKAARTHGVISLNEARACGAQPMQLHRWVQAGRIQRMGRRNFTFPGQPVTWYLQLRAALNDVGPTAVLSHRSAAALHGFEGYPEGIVELTTPRSQRRRAIEAVHHSSGTIPKLDRCVAKGFATTSAARTVIDLAAASNITQLEGAIDAAMRNGQISAAFLAKRMEALRGRGRSGIPLLDELLIDTGGANRLERRFLQLCREAGLPRPACQVTHRVGAQTVARVDFDFHPATLVVEVEGQVAHASPRERQRDAERRRHLAVLGRVVYSFTYEDIFKRPDTVTNDVRAALAANLRVTKDNQRV